MEDILAKAQREKCIEKKKRYIWDMVRKSNICVIGVPKVKERKNREERIIEETKSGHFLKIKKRILLQIQECLEFKAWKIPRKGYVSAV